MLVHSKFKFPNRVVFIFSRTFLCLSPLSSQVGSERLIYSLALGRAGTHSHVQFPGSLLAFLEMFESCLVPGHPVLVSALVWLFPPGHLSICWHQLLIHDPWQSLQHSSPQMSPFCANSKPLPNHQFSGNGYNPFGAWALWLLSLYLAGEYRTLGIDL